MKVFIGDQATQRVLRLVGVSVIIPIVCIAMTGTCLSQNKKENGWHSERKIVHHGLINIDSGILCDTREDIEMYVALNPRIYSNSTDEELGVEGCGYIPDNENIFATYRYEYTYETNEIIAKVLEVNTEEYGPVLLLHKLTYAPRT